MRSTIPLGRVAGIPVGMHWSARVGIALLGQLVGLTVLPSTAPGLGAGAYWLAGGLAALGLGGSLLTHELAHAVVAHRAGLGVRRITLWLLGGVSELVRPTLRRTSATINPVLITARCRSVPGILYPYEAACIIDPKMKRSLGRLADRIAGEIDQQGRRQNNLIRPR
ncbi:MAG TPA: hypothetical protein VN748_16305 [Pseudonocardiaceae bacterium]|nr:hypothetical protein [Pseudonocardiaceae bacterium]